MKNFRESILKLITETSTNLPSDVRTVLKKAMEQEQAANAGLALATIGNNIDMACDNVSPICQDTGMPTFKIKTPVGANQIEMKKDILWAIEEATKMGKLRPNSVDSITGKNSGNNLGPGVPVVYFDQWENDYIEAKLVLKGGGCENKNIQYSLPATLEHVGKAGRDLDGVRKCILHAIWQAQGQGCSIGFIGVGIGGDRTSGYSLAKDQLFRRLDDVNPDERLAKLEEDILTESNKLGIGTMGFGGALTCLGVKIGAYDRLPASFFVSVAYNCWAFRRLGVKIDASTGDINSWLYRDDNEIKRMAQSEGFTLTGREVILEAPITEEQVRKIKVGDIVVINGEMHTGRDAFHKHVVEHGAATSMKDGVLYHCGPVVLKDESGKWHIKAAGPTTSIREEPYQADVIKQEGVRVVIGKGGMGKKTLDGLGEHGAIYVNAIGGAAQFYAESIRKVTGVDHMEFGLPEAMWHLQVQGFTGICTMDSHGNSLHADVEASSAKELAALIA
jgi:fumarate hydratase, class I